MDAVTEAGGDGLYLVFLTIHSWLRWLALGLGAAATLNALRDAGPLGGRPRGAWWDTLFMAVLDVQVIVGLFLYFGLSPTTRTAFADIGRAVATTPLRYWTIDHAGLMFAAVVLVRIGRVLALGAGSVAARRRHRVVWFALTLAILIAGTPWPVLSIGRPLFRGLP